MSSKEKTCEDNSGDLINMLCTCYAVAERSKGGGSFQAVDTLNGKLLYRCDDMHACVAGSTSGACTP
ncbi:hypothetical protein GOBAR_AA10142 [Gossypium barbadense]|uniref:Uncharacterized protein n=1 Tax=Gossypium barbadense TaxID=3634 RepID=A0A2P5Y4G9_GOSBA|nr:hypothetical protein GOBAR_AA10142 [Gossypium barbadense]